MKRMDRSVSTPPLKLPEGARIVVPVDAVLPPSIRQMDGVSRGDPSVNCSRVLRWDPAIPLRLELVPAGFNFLHKWHAAAPLFDYNTLAFQHGTLEERQRTMAVIADLRVPLYETRALFLRQCPEVDALLEAWVTECDHLGAREASPEDDQHMRLAFHRALWKVPQLLMLPLPTTWIEGKQA
jgi:hypothetical protein